MLNFGSTEKELERKLNQGRTTLILQETDEILKTKCLISEEINELHAFRGWAFYRQKQFEEARQESLLAGESSLRGLRCLAAIESYLGNLEQAEYYMNKLPDIPAKDNAKMIGFRSVKDTTPKEEILELAYKWVDGLVDPINTANLMNNTARWLLAKGEGKGDLMLALGFMRSAIEIYGTGFDNLHHRASANYWISQIMERLFGAKAAITAAEESLTLWEMQLSVNPASQNYINSHKGAEERLEELTEKLRNARVIGALNKPSRTDCTSFFVPSVATSNDQISNVAAPNDSATFMNCEIINMNVEWENKL